ncbi:MAG: flotillin family protein, partial [Nonlabens ulvanivorans]
RAKQVAITNAEAKAQDDLIKVTKAAEASKQAAVQKAEEINIEALAHKEASEKEADARKILAEAQAKEEATVGLSEAQVMHAKAEASERQGIVDALIIQKKAEAEASGIAAKAEAKRKDGLAEAEVIKEKALADAAGIEEKAEAMKKLDGVGKEHEEFKLRLDKELQVDLAQINIQKDIADAQAQVIGDALKAAKIDIVGGETMFFEQIIGQITKAKGYDRLVNHSETVSEVKDAILGSDDVKGNLLDKVKDFADKYNISSEDIKNLSIANILNNLHGKSNDGDEKNMLSNLMNMAKGMGLSGKKLGDI